MYHACQTVTVLLFVLGPAAAASTVTCASVAGLSAAEGKRESARACVRVCEREIPRRDGIMQRLAVP